MSTPAQVWQYRELVGNLISRDLRSRYKKSFLGWGWSLVNPAVTLGIYSVVFGVFLNGRAPVAGNGSTDSFALWLFAALVCWNTFSAGVTTSMGSFLASGALLTRTYFPPEAPVVAGVTTVLTQTAIETGILLAIMIAVANVSWTFIWLVPILLLLTAFTLGVGMLVSLLNVRYRDINYLVGIGLQLMFWGTPIIYSAELAEESDLPGVGLMLRLNPMTHFVAAIRRSSYLLESPTIGNWIGMGLSASLALVIGWTFFSRNAPRYIEEI